MPEQAYATSEVASVAVSNERQENAIRPARTAKIESIARSAYFKWIATGRVHGHDVEHWLEAEAELRADKVNATELRDQPPNEDDRFALTRCSATQASHIVRTMLLGVDSQCPSKLDDFNKEHEVLDVPPRKENSMTINFHIPPVVIDSEEHLNRAFPNACHLLVQPTDSNQKLVYASTEDSDRKGFINGVRQSDDPIFQDLGSFTFCAGPVNRRSLADAINRMQDGRSE